MRASWVFFAVIIHAVSSSKLGEQCSLNGHWANALCQCDPGWKGSSCAELDLVPASPSSYGLTDFDTPSWGGGAVWVASENKWHLIVGSRAAAPPNNSDALADYPCDSRVVRAVSKGSDPAGPYSIEQVMFHRSTWEPGLAAAPTTMGGNSTLPLVLMFFGNLSDSIPPLFSTACAIPSVEYNLTTTNTYITTSATGSPRGPWTTPQLVKGMENDPLSTRNGRSKDPYSWHCASGNPSPAYHPNGTLYAAMRQNPCWKGYQTREHIGLWRADNGWDGDWTLVSTGEPLFGWGDAGGSERNCTDANACPCHEDPHLWIDERGFHLLTHDQNNHKIHSTRGAYGWSLDGLAWVLETLPTMGNSSAWAMDLRWANGTTTPLVRKQRVSLVRDPVTGWPTHTINGADFNTHLPPSKGSCEGCHWGQGFTLVQPLGNGSNAPEVARARLIFPACTDAGP